MTFELVMLASVTTMFYVLKIFKHFVYKPLFETTTKSVCGLRHSKILLGEHCL